MGIALCCPLLRKRGLNWYEETFGLDAVPDQVDPLRQVAVDAPACDAGGGYRRGELCVECEIAHRLSPRIGDHTADRTQMPQQRVRRG